MPVNLLVAGHPSPCESQPLRRSEGRENRELPEREGVTVAATLAQEPWTPESAFPPKSPVASGLAPKLRTMSLFFMRVSGIV